MFRKRQFVPILCLLAALLACNTLFPNLPKDTVPPAARKDGECSDPRFKKAELAAFQTLLQDRAAATDAFNQAITRIEAKYKARLLKLRTDYNKALNQCKDTACSQNAKSSYDGYVTREQVSHEGAIDEQEDREQRLIAEAQDEYNKAVEQARQKYCSPAYRASAKIAEATVSGVICSLGQPFTLEVSTSFVDYKIEFSPTSPGAGTYSFQWAKGVTTMGGSGNYTVQAAETDTPRLSLSRTNTGVIPLGSDTDGGAVVINLAPLDTDECKQP
jgi:hypothetical protein